MTEKQIHPMRRKLPNDRKSVVHKFNVGGHKGYIIVGLFEDGTPGEIFIVCHKEGSTMAGLLDCIAILTSISLQHGVSLDYLINKFKDQKFEPSGITTNPDIQYASSISDYIFRWLGSTFQK